MHKQTEAAFLRSIAEEGEDNTGRLVFADWLEDNGDPARAEFLRVQCELTSAKLAKKRREQLRLRERALLDAHRAKWCQAFGVPIEDVWFERGLIARARLAEWAGGKFLKPKIHAHFAPLKELDLSGLQLGDERVKTFAKRAELPSLHKLILSENTITTIGAKALATATGLPNLETIYLFGNSITTTGRTALEKSSQFSLKVLDLGEREAGYCMSPGEVDLARRRYIREQLLPVVSRYFQNYERLQSAILCVAQFWADEATDAVHGNLIVSELSVPILGVNISGVGDAVRNPNLPTTTLENVVCNGSSSISLWREGVQWDDNGRAIPMWAAFAPEGEIDGPALLFFRHGGYDVFPMPRPHLDGIRPEWEDYE